MNTDDDDKPPVPSTTVDYCRTISQDLRHLDDGLTHAIDQLTTFNSETMSDLSLKYEYIRNNEVNIIQAYLLTLYYYINFFLVK